ncbi:uncharacterized protein LOC115768294 [Drosophila novamexicana]|uniref:uncharacterized protein LOC115768294 n=1 Tax=Drosophila novamexicana TaxID=47314 RepID=UPI0011E5D327|nr:uncharacterized protein LOC115768294 [Drosophila novamexicana]
MIKTPSACRAAGPCAFGSSASAMLAVFFFSNSLSIYTCPTGTQIVNSLACSTPRLNFHRGILDSANSVKHVSNDFSCRSNIANKEAWITRVFSTHASQISRNISWHASDCAFSNNNKTSAAIAM